MSKALVWAELAYALNTITIIRRERDEALAHLRIAVGERDCIEARAARLEDDRAQASNRLSLIVFHLREFEKSRNVVTLGYAIKCGDALIKSLDAALSPPQSLPDETVGERRGQPLFPDQQYRAKLHKWGSVPNRRKSTGV